MYKYLILLLLFTTQAMGSCKIYNVINKLAPHIDRKSTNEYAIIIDKYSYVYDIDWKIVVAIFNQESNFRIEAVNYKSLDFGIGQINYKNLKKRDINLGRLLTEKDYAIHETYKILFSLKEKYNTNAKGWYRWYTRYNSFNHKYRKIYYKRLSKHFKKINKVINVKKSKFKTKRPRDRGALPNFC